LLTKLNATLISIVKQEWTTSWQNFVTDICTDAARSQSRCENALNILKLLSEEVFDFSKNTLLSQQASKLKEIMTTDFNQIFKLCYWVLEQAAGNPQMIKPSLVRSCLRTFQTFLSWIPFEYIFNTELIPIILNHFLVPNTSRIEAIKCFGEIAALLGPPDTEGKTVLTNVAPVQTEENRPNQEKLCLYFCIYIQKIVEITKNRSLLDEFNSVRGSKHQSGFENFARQIAMVIVAVIKGNIRVIEQLTDAIEANDNINMLRECLKKALEIMV
jgi:Exportin 1-like protein